jgi:hypothetical protein
MSFSQISGAPVQIMICYVSPNESPPPHCVAPTEDQLNLLMGAANLSQDERNELTKLLGTPLDKFFNGTWLQLQSNPATNTDSMVVSALESVPGVYGAQAKVPTQGTLQAQIYPPSMTGTNLALQYLLPGATASFSKDVSILFTFTCDFNVSFDLTLEIDVLVPNNTLYELTVTPTVQVQNVNFYPSNVAAAVGWVVAEAAEAIGNWALNLIGMGFEQQIQLIPSLSSLNQVIPVTGPALNTLSTVLQGLSEAFTLAAQQGFSQCGVRMVTGPSGNALEFDFTHPFDPGPQVSAGNFLSGGPILLSAHITPSLPVVNAGGTLGVTGTNFPPNTATQLRITWTDTASGIITSSELSWGVNSNGEAASPTDVIIDRSAPNSNFYTAGTAGDPLMPDTSYAFRVRDYDVFGLVATDWGPWTCITTAPTNQVSLVLSYDNSTVGTENLDINGNFSATVYIPPNIPPGTYTLSAMLSGQQMAQTTITVMGENDQPNPVLQFVDPARIPFGGTVLFDVPAEVTVAGTYFGPGDVSLFMDSPSGTSLGTAIAGPGGTTFYYTFILPLGAVWAHAVYAQQGALPPATAPFFAEMPPK